MNKIFAETTLPASIEQLPRLMNWLEQIVEPLQIDVKILRKIELALEEAVVNIVRHGYQNKAGMIQILVEGSRIGPLSITIKDQAPAFNPLIQTSLPQKNHSLEQTREGGWGIYFMRQSVDEIKYHRDMDKNVLILITHFSQKK